MKDPCGGCHQWVSSPRIVNGVCTACQRTEQAIRDFHGMCQLEERFTAAEIAGMRQRMQADPAWVMPPA